VLRRRPQLNGGEPRVAQQELAHRIALDLTAGRQIVLDDECADLGELDDPLPVVSAGIGEDDAAAACASGRVRPALGRARPASEESAAKRSGRERLGGRAVGQSSASGNDRCRRGGTRKFWRCVVVSTELKPCARERGSTSSFVPSGS
jgi:hypothetical protein